MNNVKKLRKTMRYHPNLIILKVFLRYMTQEEQIVFNEKISKCKSERGKMFTNLMLKNFDIEKLKDAPLIWQDIWIYNYCKYEIGDRIRKTKLIKRYEFEVLIISDEDFWKCINMKK